MIGGSELEALEVVHDAGGEIAVQVLSRRMGINPNYARLILKSLALDDYIDLMASGKYRITAKGKKEVKGEMT
jgi:Mn-dependent DtxR family transcriptional regulator